MTYMHETEDHKMGWNTMSGGRDAVYQPPWGCDACECPEFTGACECLYWEHSQIRADKENGSFQ